MEAALAGGAQPTGNFAATSAPRAAGASGRWCYWAAHGAACGKCRARVSGCCWEGRGCGRGSEGQARAGLWDMPGHSEAAAGVQVWQRKHLAMSEPSHITPTARTPGVTPLTRVGCERANALRPHTAIAPLALGIATHPQRPYGAFGPKTGFWWITLNSRLNMPCFLCCPVEAGHGATCQHPIAS